MKEKLYTIPLNDALAAKDECPFCYIERIVEEDLLDFTLGSGASYMEGDIRAITDNAGFCRAHFKKMFDYGNTLGNGWILKTHYIKTNKEMLSKFKSYTPSKSSFMSKLGKPNPNSEKRNSVSAWIEEREHSCYICDSFKETYQRYLDTFFIMYKKDEQFRESVKNSKGFCLTHFGDLCEYGEYALSDKEKESFYKDMFLLMETNMKRLEEDVSWLVEKFDYRNHAADWKESKDSIQRGMQKLKGGYPNDPPYKMNK